MGCGKSAGIIAVTAELANASRVGHSYKMLAGWQAVTPLPVAELSAGVSHSYDEILRVPVRTANQDVRKSANPNPKISRFQLRECRRVCTYSSGRNIDRLNKSDSGIR
jgi:hypothetical protein